MTFELCFLLLQILGLSMKFQRSDLFIGNLPLTPTIFSPGGERILPIKKSRVAPEPDKVLATEIRPRRKLFQKRLNNHRNQF